MTALVVIVLLLAFRKEVRQLVSGAKVIIAASTSDLVSEAKAELRKQAKAAKMPDYDKASIEDIQEYLANN